MQPFIICLAYITLQYINYSSYIGAVKLSTKGCTIELIVGGKQRESIVRKNNKNN